MAWWEWALVFGLPVSVLGLIWACLLIHPPDLRE